MDPEKQLQKIVVESMRKRYVAAMSMSCPTHGKGPNVVANFNEENGGFKLGFCCPAFAELVKQETGGK